MSPVSYSGSQHHISVKVCQIFNRIVWITKTTFKQKNIQVVPQNMAAAKRLEGFFILELIYGIHLSAKGIEFLPQTRIF